MILQEIMQKLRVPRNTILQLVDMGKIIKIGRQYEITDEEFFEDFTLEKHRAYIKEQKNLKISTKNKANYAKLSEEEKLQRNQKISKNTKIAMHRPDVYENLVAANNRNRQKIAESVTKHWQNMTQQEYETRCNNIKKGLMNMSNSEKKIMIASMRETLKLLYSDKDYLQAHRKRIKDGMTLEVCEKISKNTKIAMHRPDVYEKVVYYNNINVEKATSTKKKNGTVTSSKPAEASIELASKLFSAIELEKAYPGLDNHYHCDMYVKDLDLWVEFNFTWTHGGEPYDETNKKHQEKLARWEEKAKTSGYYRSAILVWTYGDPRRAQIAKEHNLNWIAFYSLREFEQWLTTLI